MRTVPLLWVLECLGRRKKIITRAFQIWTWSEGSQCFSVKRRRVIVHTVTQGGLRLITSSELPCTSASLWCFATDSSHWGVVHWGLIATGLSISACQSDTLTRAHTHTCTHPQVTSCSEANKDTVVPMPLSVERMCVHVYVSSLGGGSVYETCCTLCSNTSVYRKTDSTVFKKRSVEGTVCAL